MLKIYNTMSRKLDEIIPIEPGVVKMYTCGPTVYRDAHIGNLRSYLMADWVRRILEIQGYEVRHVKNITDVGHMRQEVLEQGEDKVIAAAIAEGKTPAQIAQFYTDRFLADEADLNIHLPMVLPKATDHIPEMLEIVEDLVDKGFAYVVNNNVYFSVSDFPDYGKLSGNIHEAELLEAVRVEADPNKRDLRDFTLWKAAEEGRTVKWPSRWGEGFPGWHIECSAMSIKYLGRRFDIHTGGVDNIFPHHEGEIGQSEAFTGKPVVNTWLHGQHLLADGVKMSKSTGNSFILSDIQAKGIEPLAFRYLCMTARYRNRLNFTFSSLKASQRGLHRLKNRVWEWSSLPSDESVDESAAAEWQGKFLDRLNDNLDVPGALTVTWAMAKSGLSGQTKLAIIREFDKVLALDLESATDKYQVSAEILARVNERETLRAAGDYSESDRIRRQLDEDGYIIQDTASGARVRPKAEWEKVEEARNTVSSGAEVPSLVNQPDTYDVTIGMVANNYKDDVKRAVESALNWVGDRNAEAVVLDNGSTDGTSEWLDELAASEPRVRVIHADHTLGEGVAKNIILKQSLGRTVVLVDTSVEITGDIYSPIDNYLDREGVGVVGPFGLRTDDLHHFHDGEGESGKMDAMQAYCFAFRRVSLRDVGLMRESFRFYRNLDIDYSFHFKDQGYQIVADQSIPVVLHEHRVWSDLAEGERDELSLKNYRRFLEKWGDRTDLLVSSEESDGDAHPHTH
ncbi:MAG: cysteine--tRNA ligase [Chloroflexi bacterium]|nr:cysteine--tRNA ligase [Chloroflexota bacterium]